MIFARTGKFKKKATKLPKKLKLILEERLLLFANKPFHTLLNNHALHGSLQSYRSINITGDYRLIYEDYSKDTVRLIDIDTHSNLYDNVVTSIPPKKTKSILSNACLV